ncbi:MAG: sigma 54-interacting transcriptional regulator [Sulfurimonas sp.]|uniref:sigma 54-interacting transcriptional regulator n=1 Tax=Sulfurimonas sp. TaxID=2022749 RepID=UPI0025F4D2D0|nr:sigma 54-interacting transcriptional regulator [Sulfurimonas sp.]MCK9491138.1 sigma 54-interacting transcriptional regulator [Sulfurimonas sp.]
MLKFDMENFIALSLSSKKALHVAKMSVALPVNILILGEIGVGKKTLAQEILQNSQSYEATEIEKLILNKQIDIQSFKSLILYNIDALINKKQFFENLKTLRIIATASQNYKDDLNTFPIKIRLEPLSERKEDLEELISIYIKEANKIYYSNKTAHDVEIDISKNGISLKQSIYKSILLSSITKNDIMDILYKYFISDLKSRDRSYKDLLDIFEIPLLKAFKERYKSQVQMANHLCINRMTLRKKLNSYYKVKKNV